MNILPNEADNLYVNINYGNSGCMKRIVQSVMKLHWHMPYAFHTLKNLNEECHYVVGQLSLRTRHCVLAMAALDKILSMV